MAIAEHYELNSPEPIMVSDTYVYLVAAPNLKVHYFVGSRYDGGGN
ncbi:hypothetical protein KAI46_06965 [bacterium]|nr:hypothetical protein [bacterium]